MTVHHDEIFYIDPRNGWALASYDAEGNQLGEARYAFHRSDLTQPAKTNTEYPTEVYSSTGRLVHTINGE